MFDNLDFALAMLQVTSGLTGLTFVAIGFVPVLFERAEGRYERFVAQAKVDLLLRLTRVSFGAFASSVLVSLVWSIAIMIKAPEWLLITGGVVCLLAFVVGISVTAYVIFRYLGEGAEGE